MSFGDSGGQSLGSGKNGYFAQSVGEESFGHPPIVAAGPMILKVDTTITGFTASDSIRINFATGTYNFTIDWGDESTEVITTSSVKTHTYTTGGIYEIKINTDEGTFSGGLTFNGTSNDEPKYLEIKQWGTDCTWTTFSQAFYNCINIEHTAIDSPTTSGLTTMYRAFRGCHSITNLPLFDVSSVTNWETAFFDCQLLLSIPDYVASPTTLESFANSCYSLVSMPSSSGFDTSLCTSFRSFMRNCNVITTCPAYDFSAASDLFNAFGRCFLLTTFDGTITLKSSGSVQIDSIFDNCHSIESIPIVSLPTGVTDFNGITNGCFVLSTLPAWDTSNVTNFNNAFSYTNLDSFDFSTFDFSAMTSGSACFTNLTLTTAVYDQILIDLDANNVETNVTFGAGGSVYTKAVSAADTARTALLNRSPVWVISDGGPTA